MAIDPAHELAVAIKRSNKSQAAFARDHGLPVTTISDVLNSRREPPKSMLEVLGLEAITVYRKKAPQ